MPGRVPAAARAWADASSVSGTFGHVDGPLAPVHPSHQLRQLLGIAADIAVDGSRAALLVARGGHPDGGADHDATVADQGGRRGELGRFVRDRRYEGGGRDGKPLR